MPPDDEKPVGRRRFFRLGLSELLRPLVSAAKPLERVARELGKLDQPRVTPSPAPKNPFNTWLRPPGALPEDKFAAACTRCGDCVRICPANAIQIDATGKSGNGLPYINADSAACVVCEGLQCMSACPSGALVPTSINDIDMGTAVWNEQTCVRTTKGESCTICADHCPLGTAAIEIKSNAVVVKPLGCIGCGVCQRDCPTNPRSIVVIPIAAKTAGR